MHIQTWKLAAWFSWTLRKKGSVENVLVPNTGELTRAYLESFPFILWIPLNLRIFFYLWTRQIVCLLPGSILNSISPIKGGAILNLLQGPKRAVCFKENALFWSTNSASWSNLLYSLRQWAWSTLAISEFINSYVWLQEEKKGFFKLWRAMVCLEVGLIRDVE